MLLPSGFHSHGEAIAKHLRPSQVKGLALWVGGTILAHSNCQNAVLGVSEVYRDLAIPVAPAVLRAAEPETKPTRSGGAAVCPRQRPSGPSRSWPWGRSTRASGWNNRRPWCRAPGRGPEYAEFAIRRVVACPAPMLGSCCAAGPG